MNWMILILGLGAFGFGCYRIGYQRGESQTKARVLNLVSTMVRRLGDHKKGTVYIEGEILSWQQLQRRIDRPGKEVIVTSITRHVSGAI